MSEDRFWSLIAVMDGQADDDAVARLAQALSAYQRKDIVAFQERLARVLYTLDREELADQPVCFTGDPPGSQPIPLGDDTFLFLRAGIVASGRDRYLAVLANPSLLASGEWDECEKLLYVAEGVIGEAIYTVVSYATGSNEQFWPLRPEPVDEEQYQDSSELVRVDLRDLSDPIEGGGIHPDGLTDYFQWYPPPGYVDQDMVDELSTTFATLIAANGGLPTELEVGHLVVVIEFGSAWRLQPLVSDPVEDRFLDLGMIREVCIGVCSDIAQTWPERILRKALLALVARCVLTILPEDHAARPDLQHLYQQGAKHLS